MNAGGVDKACKSNGSVRSTDPRINTNIGASRYTKIHETLIEIFRVNSCDERSELVFV